MARQLEAGDLRTFRVVVVGDADNIKGTEQRASEYTFLLHRTHASGGSVGDAKKRLSVYCRKNAQQCLATSVSKEILTLYSRAEKGNL